MSAISWLLTNIGMGFYNFFYALSHPGSWLNWSDPESLTRFIYYGGHQEFFFVVIDIFLVVTVIGMWRRHFLWRVLRGLEGMANGIGRVAAWAGLLMVLQQIIIVFLQRIFRVSDISIGPFGYIFRQDISWFAEELKLYNALVVALCVSYTFVQGGHVRVDLFYARISFRAKRLVDMFGSLFFILPTMTLTWLYGWFFLWRHLVVPKPAAADSLEKLLRKSDFLRWNVETIGFSPNGFNAYFLFKILLVSFAGLMFLQGIAFFYRSYLEFKEGPESAGKHLDKDILEVADTEDIADAKLHVGVAE